jgi:hypothetical protein
MTCIFCGGEGRRSGEHVVPLWIDQFFSQLPPTRANPGGKRMTQRFTPALDAGVPAREWDSDGPDLKTNSVCERCNNGWLSDLETTASGLVGPLVLGDPTTLDAAGQRTIATWGYKTALLMQMLRPEGSRVVPTARFEELHGLGRPPSDARIWLAHRRGGNVMQETFSAIRITGGGVRVPGFFSVLAFGRMIILVAARLAPGPERMRIGSDVDPQITVQIWPGSVRGATWPPPTPLTDLKARSIIASL